MMFDILFGKIDELASNASKQLHDCNVSAVNAFVALFIPAMLLMSVPSCICSNDEASYEHADVEYDREAVVLAATMYTQFDSGIGAAPSSVSVTPVDEIAGKVLYDVCYLSQDGDIVNLDMSSEGSMYTVESVSGIAGIGPKTYCIESDERK